MHARKESWLCIQEDAAERLLVEKNICSLCGTDFTGLLLAEQLDHLVQVHRIGECNAKRKFYRKDALRLHFQNFHGNQEGDWLNDFIDLNCHETTEENSTKEVSPDYAMLVDDHYPQLVFDPDLTDLALSSHNLGAKSTQIANDFFRYVFYLLFSKQTNLLRAFFPFLRSTKSNKELLRKHKVLKIGYKMKSRLTAQWR